MPALQGGLDNKTVLKLCASAQLLSALLSLRYARKMDRAIKLLHKFLHFRQLNKYATSALCRFHPNLLTLSGMAADMSVSLAMNSLVLAAMSHLSPASPLAAWAGLLASLRAAIGLEKIELHLFSLDFQTLRNY